jgi:uncharacterized glyoxalase superfamily protein PhnB
VRGFAAIVKFPVTEPSLRVLFNHSTLSGKELESRRGRPLRHRRHHVNTYPPIVPYLAVEDADRAIDFYKAAFGAEERMRMPSADGASVMHAELLVRGGYLMLANASPDKNFRAPRPGEVPPLGLMLAYDVADEVDSAFRRAVELGARVETEPTDADWGSRFAGIIDPFGHRWWLHAPIVGGM